MSAGKIPFDRIAVAALNRAATLVAEWLPDGKPEGHEYKALNPTRGDSRPGSFSINLNTGMWADFATGDTGGDLVSLYAYLFTNGDQGKAARDLAKNLGIAIDAGAPAATGPAGGGGKKARSPWRPVLPVPDGTPEPPAAHFKRGVPETAWRYKDGEGRLLGLICRFRTSDGGKEILPLTWCENTDTGELEWRWMAFPEPRPLYGLDRIAAKPSAEVLLVEGEKCADVGDHELPELATVTWPGGSKADGKVDFSPLAGRTVTIWPDCDAQMDKGGQLLPEAEQPGMAAAERVAQRLQAIGCTVRIAKIPAPGDKPGGWDIADAVDGGLRGETLHPDALFGTREPAGQKARDGRPEKKPEQAKASDWTDDLLRKRGELVACVANLYDIITHVRSWDGVVAFDEFAQRTVKKKPPPYPSGAVGEWDGGDDTHAAMWFKLWGLAPSSAMVAEAIEAVARANAFHPVRDWLRSRPPWDRRPRLRGWVTDYLGVENTPYSLAAGQYFLRGMVGRVMRPGIKFDFCLVLEGLQGKGKSTAMAILGGEWFGDTDLDLHNKDSMSALRGKWLYEFSELGSVTRAESTRQKSFLSRQVDEFRPVYGRREIRCPRQVVFAGTTNETWEWNKDPTGGRRFWPLFCKGDFNLKGLAEVRDQLFAEALHDWDAGERYWPTPEEQRELFDPEQLQRVQQESLVDALHDWVFNQIEEFSLFRAAQDCLNLDASKLSRDMQTRIGMALRSLGCSKVEKRNGMIRYWYKPPKKAVASVPDRPAASPERGDDRAPF